MADVMTRPTATHRIAVQGREPRHFVPFKNKPGEMVRLDKHEIHIDAAYQRPLQMRRVQRIAANWSYIACGVLLVSLRSDGAGYFAFDGQHRLAAAMLCDEVKDLSCLVFELNDVTEEAVGFLAANTERKIPSLSDQFNALLLAGDPLAKAVDSLAREAGRIVGAPADKTHIACVSVLIRAVRDDEPALRRIWPLIVSLAHDHSLPARLVIGLLALERRMPSGHSLSDARWATRLKAVGLDVILQNVATTCGLEGNSSERACGMGVLRALNKGLRNPVRVDFDSKLRRAA